MYIYDKNSFDENKATRAKRTSITSGTSLEAILHPPSQRRANLRGEERKTHFLLLLAKLETEKRVAGARVGAQKLIQQSRATYQSVSSVVKVAVRRVHPSPLEAEPVGLNGFDDCPRAVGDFDVVAVHALVVELVGLGFPLLGRRSPLVRDNVVIALHYYWSRGTNNRHANGKPERGGVSGVSAVPVFEMVGCRSYIASCD